MGLSTAIGLATSAGLNAYIPLLAYGLLARYTDFVSLPEGWMWLTDPILLSIVGALLLIEIVADKVPAVDSVNDVIQTLIRPTSGGLMFASAFADETVSSGSVFSEPKTWVLLVVGFAVALAMHLFKTTARPAVNAGTAGLGAPVVSTAEDVVAASLTATAIFAPVLVLVVLAIVLAPVVWMVVKFRQRVDKRRQRELSY
ncbi:DUF4126 domain-containing protein [Corynebacterium vitaeruminis]|uniref:DUF4126 domain-containing protein n=1 Tax=Corynebacterium vitaeruminis DSM 20294 TaxID=1224164 RepID=W5Y1L5_9CORY|nr:DUF4126 domain-containing protein [Corynebacterium vitaeruminis]AHI22839.1 hypothetical protein B843_07270 [Corynebacterium vitaeruminis DSM 20294]